MVKAVAFAPDGAVVSLARRSNTFSAPRPREAECDMERVWELVAACLQDLTGALAEMQVPIAAVGVSGNMGGAWLLDADGLPVRPAILWNDGRAGDLLARWRKRGIIPKIFAESCNTPAPGFTLPVLAWLSEHEPETLDRSRHLVFSKDWIRYRLTGDLGSEESDASHMPGSIAERGYARGLFDVVGIPELQRLLVPLRDSGEVAGKVHRAAAEATGLRPGTPVITGLADVTAMLTGAGAIEPGAATVVLGTSCLNSVTTASPVFEPHDVGLSFLIPNGRYTRTLSNQTGTLALTWFWREFMSASAGAEPVDFARMEAMAADSPLGAQGLVFHPYLNGTGVTAPVYEPTARGRLWGLGVEHTRSDVLRAIYEGVVFSIADCFEYLPPSEGPVQLLGGGARSRFWAQMLADALGRPVEVAGEGEFGALGVAILAGVATGVWSSTGDAVAACRRPSERVTPSMTRHERYGEILSLYQFLRRDLPAEREFEGKTWKA